jgi:hypothetical protein
MLDSKSLHELLVKRVGRKVAKCNGRMGPTWSVRELRVGRASQDGRGGRAGRESREGFLPSQ